MEYNNDKNFDGMAPRFQRNIYASLKGDIRLAVLKRDFFEHIFQLTDVEKTDSKGTKVFDAGGGQGHFALDLARYGCDIVLCDLSQDMLETAKQQVVAAGLETNFRFINDSVQSYLVHDKQTFDIVLCHALLEWLENPLEVLRMLADALRPGGYLSLIYYNLDGLIYKNLLRTNFKKIRKQQWSGFRGSLTPTHPLQRQQVNEWLITLPLTPLCESGIRVFSDYILDKSQRERDRDGVIEMELAFSRRDPFRYFGRYVHVLLRKQP